MDQLFVRDVKTRVEQIRGKKLQIFQKVAKPTKERLVKKPHGTPRLNFAPEFIGAIKRGKKTATTRMAFEDDPNSDLDDLRPGVVCAATSAHGEFAKLRIAQR